MIHILTYFKNDSGYQYRYKGTDTADRYLRLQIDALNHIGEVPIIATNFDFEYGSVKALKMDKFADWSAFANKVPALNAIIKHYGIADDICYKDVDCYTLIKHEFPTKKDMGFVLHSLPGRSKLQGGCQYWSRNSYDIIEVLAERMITKRIKKEEKYFNRFFRVMNWTDRLDILNYRYNFFRQSEMERKYVLTQLPIINMHFKWEYETCTNRFVEGKNRHNVKVCPEWLRDLAIKHQLYKESNEISKTI